MIKISRLVTSKMVRRRLAFFCIMCMFGCFRPLGYSSKAKADWKRDCLACPEESPRRMYVPAVYSWICSQRFCCTLINRNKYEKANCCLYGDCINILFMFVMSFHDWLDKRQKIMIKAIHHDDAEVLNYDELLNDQGHNTPNQRVIVRIDSLQNF